MPFSGQPSSLQPMGSSLSALMSQLDEGVRSASILVLTDSTGNYSSPAWPQLVGAALGALYPNFNVKLQFWNPSLSPMDYDPATTLQAGPNGDTYIDLTTGAGRGRYQTQADVGTPSGDLDLRADAALVNWSPSTYNTFIAMCGGGSSVGGLQFVVDNNGYVRFVWWDSGGTAHQGTSTSPLGYAANSRHVLRVTLVVATGVVTFYSATDIDAAPASWTSLGGFTVGATTVRYPSSPYLQPWEIGGYNAQGASGTGTSAPLIGKIYQAQIRNGINGPIMNQHPIDNWMPQTAFAQPPIAGSPTLWIINGSYTGALLSVLAANVGMMARPYVDAAVLFSCGKNDLGLWGKSYLASWASYVAAVKALVPCGSFTFLSQFPDVQVSTSVDYEGVMRRSREILQFAAQNGYGSIDTYKAIVKTGNVANYVLSDGVHLTPSGQVIAANAVIAGLLQQK